MEVFEGKIENEDIANAKETELNKWKEFTAYEEVDLEDQHVLTARWVITEKEGGKIKARLCVRGYEKKINPQSDSPTAHKDSLKTFLSVVANEGFTLATLDVSSAFLQGYPLDRDVFVKPLREREQKGKIWKLKKSCYGLYDASRRWFMAVNEILKEFGMKNLSGDDAFFFKIENGKLTGLCILHVDDFLIGGTQVFLTQIQKKLKGRFSFGKIEFQKFKYTGLNITQDSDGIHIDQIRLDLSNPFP